MNDLAHVFGTADGQAAGAADQDDEKLFAAIAAHRIVAANGSVEAFRHLAQNRVARGVPVTVVDLLEVINVAQNDGHAVAAIAGSAGNFALQEIKNHAAVPERGQRVVGGLEAHFCSRFDQAVFEQQNPFAGAQARA